MQYSRTLPRLLPALLLLQQAFLVRDSVALAGGEDARPRQFPFQALLVGYPTSALRQFATGVLVHPEWLLTTAESVFDYVTLTVTLGVVERDSTAASRQDIPALRVHTHPKWIYNGGRPWSTVMQNDIALVRLSRPARIDENVQVAKLPKAKSYNGYKVTVAGWGQHQTNSGLKPQNIMKWEASKTLSFLSCYWKRFSMKDETGSLRPSHICADTRTNGPCSDDNGAPLMLVPAAAGDPNVVVGLFTAPTIYQLYCREDYPSVYTRVSSHLDWIASVAGL